MELQETLLLGCIVLLSWLPWLPAGPVPLTEKTHQKDLPINESFTTAVVEEPITFTVTTSPISQSSQPSLQESSERTHTVSTTIAQEVATDKPASQTKNKATPKSDANKVAHDIFSKIITTLSPASENDTSSNTTSSPGQQVTDDVIQSSGNWSAEDDNVTTTTGPEGMLSGDRGDAEDDYYIYDRDLYQYDDDDYYDDDERYDPDYAQLYEKLDDYDPGSGQYNRYMSDSRNHIIRLPWEK